MRDAARLVRKLDQCVEVVGESARIVTNLGKRSRKGLTDGLRDFIKVNNYRALDVGELRRGTGTFKVRKPKILDGGRMLQSGKVLMS